MQNEKNPLTWGEFMAAFLTLDEPSQITLSLSLTLTELYQTVTNTELLRSILDDLDAQGDSCTLMCIALATLGNIVQEVANGR